MQILQINIAEYIDVLERSAKETNHAEDRTKYDRHLAAAALMCAAATNNDIKKIEELIENERRSFGWDFLAGTTGAAAEAAFVKLAKHVNERPRPT